MARSLRIKGVQGDIGQALLMSELGSSEEVRVRPTVASTGGNKAAADLGRVPQPGKCLKDVSRHTDTHTMLEGRARHEVVAIRTHRSWRRCLNKPEGTMAYTLAQAHIRTHGHAPVGETEMVGEGVRTGAGAAGGLGCMMGTAPAGGITGRPPATGGTGLLARTGGSPGLAVCLCVCVCMCVCAWGWVVCA